MLNYQMKNLKKILNPSDGEQTLFTRDNNIKETIIVGGQICNQYDDTAKFTLMIYNSVTTDVTYIYKDIEIESFDYLLINKISLNQNQSLIVSVVLDGNEVENTGINITINYFNVLDYDYGFIRVNFLEPLINNQQPINTKPYDPSWKIIGTDTWYSITEVISGSSDDYNLYTPIKAGEHSIEFSDINGYITPQNLNIEILPMKLTEIDVTYLINDAVVCFKCNQIDIVSSFGWRLVGGNTYYNSDQYIIATKGDQVIEFKDVDGFVTPVNQNISLIEKTIHYFNIDYGRQKGSLTVTLDPPFKRLGKSHKHLNEWYIVFPDGSETIHYNSGENIFLPPTSDEYELIISSNQYYEPSENNIKFTLENDQLILKTITMEVIDG